VVSRHVFWVERDAQWFCQILQEKHRIVAFPQSSFSAALIAASDRFFSVLADPLTARRDRLIDPIQRCSRDSGGSYASVPSLVRRRRVFEPRCVHGRHATRIRVEPPAPETLPDTFAVVPWTPSSLILVESPRNPGRFSSSFRTIN
jgi:hypothetical protein